MRRPEKDLLQTGVAEHPGLAVPLRLHRFELAEVEPRFGEHDAPIGIWGLGRPVGELGRRGAEGAQPSLRIQPWRRGGGSSSEEKTLVRR